MPYEQVKDILGRVRLFHRRVVHHFDGESECSLDNRTKEFLGELRREEHAMDRAIGQYVKETGGEKSLQVWIQYVADEDVRRVLRGLELSETMRPEELMAQKVEFDKALMELYEQLASTTSFPQVSELFEGLRRMTEQRSAQSGWWVRECQQDSRLPRF